MFLNDNKLNVKQILCKKNDSTKHKNGIYISKLFLVVDLLSFLGNIRKPNFVDIITLGKIYSISLLLSH